MIRVVAFDFDGTIADSFDAFIETFRKLALSNLDTNIDTDDLRGLSVPELLKRLHVKRSSLPRLVILGRKEMAKHISSLSIFEGVAAQLKKLHDQGVEICIMSSNSEESIYKFLVINKLDSMIDVVIGDIGLFAKARAIRSLARSYRCSADELIYVGDEVRDIQAATKAGVASIAVTWGFNTRDALEKHQPTYIANKPDDLGKLIARHSF